MIRFLGDLFAAGRRLPDVRQAEAAECGLACLTMVSCYHGRTISLNTLRQRFPVSMKGATLRTLIETAERIGLGSRPLRLELDHLDQLQTPAILHWDMTHFVVLKRAGRGKVVIHDPATGMRSLTLDEASSHFTGVALELSPVLDFKPPPPVPRVTMRSLFGTVSELRSALIQVLLLSLILQAHALVSPFYMQLMVDEAIPAGDGDLIRTLALGFGLLLLIRTGTALLRNRILATTQSALAFQMGAGLFGHLLRLPVSYFEKRHVGDLVSRFNSSEPIRHLLAEGLIAALIDGLMAVLTGVMILLYSPFLALVVGVGLALYLLLRIVLYGVMRKAALDLMVARAAEGTTFIETVRAIQSIKLFNRAAARSAVWLNRYAEVIEADTRLASLRQIFQILNEFLFGGENILVIYLGAHAVLDGRLTVGMLFAFLSYKQEFVSKAANVVEKLIEFRMLDLYLDRLADIAGAEPEPTAGGGGLPVQVISGALEVRDLAFRYAEGEPYVFRDVSFAIAPGDYVAITGPSGCGKTTLLKIMLGLLPPSQGQVLVDGLPLEVVGHETFRDHIGVVMQDDHLLSGTIADNICFFDERQDYERMMQCAEIAGVHDDIARMPMGYNSLIGDMGTSLSGGQRQRILLARALYRQPRMLFMDEGTSNLDVATERKVSGAIQALGLTRIIIAHRPETIATASRLLILDSSGLREEALSGRLRGDGQAVLSGGLHRGD